MTISPDLETLNWQKLVKPYARPDLRQGIWQLANTMIPYLALWVLMLWSLRVSYWLTLALALPTAGFMVRAFIIFHDCCHGSFFASRRANEVVGMLLGILTMTPFYQWRHDHAIHHATAGNLDKRDVGDVPTMTVQEYLAAPWWRKAVYRIVRSPWILFTVGATIMFAIIHRIPPAHADRRERWSVIYTDLALAALVAGMGLLVGFKEYFLVSAPILVIGCTAGVWLFYVQHQFEGVYWEHKERWSFVRAGMQGSSFYKLPMILQWFTGNIGFHHIHHLSPKVPNYHLPSCYRENPPFHIKPLTVLESLKTVRLHLIDDATRRLVGWDALRRHRQSAQIG